MSNLKVKKDEIWLKYDPERSAFSELVANDVRLDVNIPAEMEREVRYRLNLLREYSNYQAAEPSDFEKLTKFLMSRPIPIGAPVTLDKEAKDVESSEPVTLRSIAYDAVKIQLEQSHEANLDELVASILAKGYPGLESKRNSVTASVSSVLSALRNAFPEKIEKAWNKPVWRGKTTGRNPCIQVKKPFEMPDYLIMWQNYEIYLRKRTKGR